MSPSDPAYGDFSGRDARRLDEQLNAEREALLEPWGLDDLKDLYRRAKAGDAEARRLWNGNLDAAEAIRARLGISRARKVKRL